MKNFLPNRDDLPKYFNSRGLSGRAAEIGVQDGVFSHKLLKSWSGSKLYLIDAWRHLQDYRDVANEEHPLANLQRYSRTFQSVYQYGSRATIIRELSDAAAELFVPGSLDWVYIDADHSYEGVKKDLQSWFPKVRPGGVLSGHDFLDGELTFGSFGVKSAVTEFAAQLGKEILVTGESDFPSWVIEL